MVTWCSSFTTFSWCHCKACCGLIFKAALPLYRNNYRCFQTELFLFNMYYSDKSLEQLFHLGEMRSRLTSQEKRFTSELQRLSSQDEVCLFWEILILIFFKKIIYTCIEIDSDFERLRLRLHTQWVKRMCARHQSQPPMTTTMKIKTIKNNNLFFFVYLIDELGNLITKKRKHFEFLISYFDFIDVSEEHWLCEEHFEFSI